MKKNILLRLLLVLSLALMFSIPSLAKPPSSLLINGESTNYTLLVKNGISYMKADDFLDIFASEPPIKTIKSITYIKRSIPYEESFLEIELKDNSISWNGEKTGAYAIKPNKDFYLPLKSICKYLDYKISWDLDSNIINLESYYTKAQLEKTANVFGINFPICLFDTLPIGHRPHSIPSLYYSNNEFGERVSFVKGIMQLEEAKNFFISLGLPSLEADHIITQLFAMDGFETKEFPFLGDSILSTYGTSDGTYSFDFFKKPL